MNRLLPASLLCGFAFAASAQNATISAQTDAEATLAQGDAAVAFDERRCLPETGSRIVASNNDRRGTQFVAAHTSDRRCVNANGRVHTGEDIKRTGAIDLAEALRMLDPAIH